MFPRGSKTYGDPHLHCLLGGVHPNAQGCDPHDAPPLFSKKNAKGMELSEDDHKKMKFLTMAIITSRS